MNRMFRVLSLGAVLALAAAITIAPAAGAHDVTAPPATAGMKADLLFWISDAESKLGQLAEAMPEDKYGWSPTKDVRTPAQVFMHVAAANYGIPSMWGVAPPAGYDFATYEGSLTKKAEIQAALKGSFAHVKAALSAATDADFEKPVDLLGTKTTVRGSYMLLLAHAHEHLGQSIAYARMNKVTPPWTEMQNAAIEAKKKEAEAGAKAKGRK